MGEKVLTTLEMVQGMEIFREVWQSQKYSDIRASMLRMLKKNYFIDHVHKMAFFSEVLRETIGRVRIFGRTRASIAHEFVLGHLALAYLIEHVFKNNDNAIHSEAAVNDRFSSEKAGDLPKTLLGILGEWNLYDAEINAYCFLDASVYGMEPMKRHLRNFLRVYPGMMKCERVEPDAWYDAVIFTDNLDLFGDVRFHTYERATPRLKAFIAARLRDYLRDQPSSKAIYYDIVLSSCFRPSWRSGQYNLTRYAADLVTRFAVSGELDKSISF